MKLFDYGKWTEIYENYSNLPITFWESPLIGKEATYLSIEDVKNKWPKANAIIYLKHGQVTMRVIKERNAWHRDPP